MLGIDLWAFVVIGGPIILLFVLVYALLTRRHRGPAERRESDRATERLYRNQGD
ncbi:hypothetical protein LB535_13800 [Mesorhizobium sp. CA10]|uniref:hypothetical protein n=1 Tax=Mesorhizobium sp. CA10 TaxID=588495 RepID=UPI001CCAE82A|nr:hypothetical protein [Mesorhizobium sp. CA10]MBZ9883428.1 hypothetical protein [Mesorhizobium sp. CA10]